MHAVFRPEAAAGLHAVYEFRVDGEVFHVRIDDCAIDTRCGPADRPNVVVDTDEKTFAELALGRLRLDEAIRDARAAAHGDRKLLTKLRSLFPAQ